MKPFELISKLEELEGVNVFEIEVCDDFVTDAPINGLGMHETPVGMHVIEVKMKVMIPKGGQKK